MFFELKESTFFKPICVSSFFRVPIIKEPFGTPSDFFAAGRSRQYS